MKKSIKTLIRSTESEKKGDGDNDKNIREIKIVYDYKQFTLDTSRIRYANYMGRIGSIPIQALAGNYDVIDGYGVAFMFDYYINKDFYESTMVDFFSSIQWRRFDMVPIVQFAVSTFFSSIIMQVFVASVVVVRVSTYLLSFAATPWTDWMKHHPLISMGVNVILLGGIFGVIALLW